MWISVVYRCWTHTQYITVFKGLSVFTTIIQFLRFFIEEAQQKRTIFYLLAINVGFLCIVNII